MRQWDLRKNNSDCEAAPDASGSQPQEENNNQIPPVEGSLVRLVRTIPWPIIIPCLLAAAGLLWGIRLRVLFFRSFPDPLATPDTWSYFAGAYGLLEKGQLDLSSIRPPAFPLLLWLTLAIFKSFAGLNIVHGALTLFSALAIAFAVRAFGGPWRLPAALATFFLAVHPHLIYWEHFVMTEGSFQAFFVLALVATVLTILHPTPGRVVTAGMLTIIAGLIRPQAFFLIPLALFALVCVRRHLGRQKLIGMLALAGAGPLILLGGWVVRSAIVHGSLSPQHLIPLQLITQPDRMLHQPREFIVIGFKHTYKLVTGRITHEYYSFDELAHYDESWKIIPPSVPVDQYRAALDQIRFPMMPRRLTFANDIRPALAWETVFVRLALAATLLALLALPFLHGPRRLATSVAAISVVMLILTSSFLAGPVERYLSLIHGSAALTGALAVTGLLERWLPRARATRLYSTRRKNFYLLLLIGSLLLTGIASWGVVRGIKRDLIIPTSEITSEGGAIYGVTLREFRYGLFERLGDSLARPVQAKTELFEDDKPLGPAHSAHDKIHEVGLGQFSYWGPTLFFSTSDNSDPRSNGRRYRVVTTATTPIWALAMLCFCLLIASELNRQTLSQSDSDPKAVASAAAADQRMDAESLRGS